MAERYLPEPEQDDPFNEDPPRAPGKVGVLLVNLGTPDAPTARDIRKYLGEFLSDPRVIEIPRYLWKPILHGLVLTLRPKKLAPRYAGIWLQDGSPLMVYSRRQAEGVAAALREAGVDATVELGMRYGNPSIPDAIGWLRAQGCERIPDRAALSAVRRQHHRHGGGRRDRHAGVCATSRSCASSSVFMKTRSTWTRWPAASNPIGASMVVRRSW